MARTATIWSHLAGQTAFALLTLALAKGENFHTVDVYHDPYDLKQDHREAWDRAMRESLGKFANKAVQATGLNRGERIKIRRVRGVPKRATGADEQYVKGIWIAHEIGTESASILRGPGHRRVEARDLTAAMGKVLSEHYDE